MMAADIEDNILRELAEVGYCVVPDFLNSKELSEIKAQFTDTISNKNLQFGYSSGLAAALKTPEITSSRNKIVDLFDSEGVKSIVRTFSQGGRAYELVEIFLVKDVVGSKHIAQDLHFDIAKTLKFMIYLDDTDESNGAIRFVPRSHKWTEDFRKKNSNNINYENREVSRELPDLGDDIPICGGAGTLIVFSTEVFHRAGVVSSRERNVIRAHFREAPKVPFLNSTKRLIKSMFTGS